MRCTWPWDMVHGNVGHDAHRPQVKFACKPYGVRVLHILKKALNPFIISFNQ